MRGKRKVGLFVYYGGGKTYLSLQWLTDLMEGGMTCLPMLVLCPKNIVFQWRDQIELHSNFRASVIEGSTLERREAIAKDADIYICNYGAIRTALRYDLNRLGARCFTILADESTYLKSAKTLRFKLCQYNFRGIPNRIILTGRPLTEEIPDIWSQLLFLDDGQRLGKSYFHFMKENFDDDPFVPFGKIIKEGATQRIAERLRDICVYVPREQVAKQLPPRTIIPVYFELPRNVRKQYNELKKNFRLEFESGSVIDTQWAFVKFNKLQQIANGFVYADGEDGRVVERFECDKFDWLKDSVPEIVSQGPLLLWAFHRDSIFSICKLLEELKLKKGYGRYMGGDSETAITDFNEGKTDVLVLSQSAAFGGLNLVRAKSAINFSMGPSGDMRDNALHRNYRIGSEIHDEVIVYDLISKHTWEEVQYNAVAAKLDLSDTFLKYLVKDEE